MKTLVLLLCAASVVTAAARVGDRMGKLESRYGDPHELGTDQHDAACTAYGFDKAGVSRLRAKGFQVAAVVDSEKICVELVYQKISGSLNKREVQGILFSNNGGMNWKPVDGNVEGSVFQRGDGAVAWMSGQGCFEIMNGARAALRGIISEA